MKQRACALKVKLVPIWHIFSPSPQPRGEDRISPNIIIYRFKSCVNPPYPSSSPPPSPQQQHHYHPPPTTDDPKYNHKYYKRIAVQ